MPQWLTDLLTPLHLTAATGGTTVLGLVGSKFHKMDKEIRECRARDARFVVIEAGFRMVVGEMVRERPESIALQMCGDLLNRKLGPPPSVGDINDLIAKLDGIPSHE